MATLLFFDHGHRYTLDGEELPSVSELCRFLTREIYGTIPQYTLDNAADRGHRVHKLTEAIDVYGKADVPDDLLPYLQAYVKFRQEHQVQWTHIEKPLAHQEKRYAGTLDRIGTVDGKNAIVDLKTTYQLHKPLLTAQLNLYRWMAEAAGIPVEALYALQLKKDGTYRLSPVEINDEVPAAVLTLHNLLKKKARKKNARTNADAAPAGNGGTAAPAAE